MFSLSKFVTVKLFLDYSAVFALTVRWCWRNIRLNFCHFLPANGRSCSGEMSGKLPPLKTLIMSKNNWVIKRPVCVWFGRNLIFTNWMFTWEWGVFFLLWPRMSQTNRNCFNDLQRPYVPKCSTIHLTWPLVLWHLLADGCSFILLPWAGWNSKSSYVTVLRMRLEKLFHD